MLCDFLSYMSKKNKEMSDLRYTLSNARHDDSARSTFFKSERTFWDTITKLTSSLKNSDYVSNLIAGEVVDEMTELPLPADFKSMTRGYAPFTFFDRGEKEFEDASLVPISDRENKSKAQPVVDAYLSFEEAVDALELYPARGSSQSSQRSKKSMDRGDSKGGSQMEVQTRLKMNRFMRFISRHVESGDIVETDQEDETPEGTASDQKDTTDGGLSPGDNDMDWDSQTKEDAENNKSDTKMAVDEPEEDIVVYKETGNGPALLVPGAFLVSSNEKQEKNQRKMPSPQSCSPSNAAIVHSTSGLLNLSALLNQSVNDPDPVCAKDNSDTIARNGNDFGIVTSHSGLATVVPPMPQSSSPKTASKVTGGPVLRPPPGLGLPPGFNNADQPSITNLQNVNHPPPPSHLGNLGIQSTRPNNFENMGQHYMGEKFYGRNPLTDSNVPTLTPFQHSFQPNGRPDGYPYPGHTTSVHPHTIPPTSNPFAYPMPPLGSSNNRFQGLNMPTPSHLPNDLGMNPAPPMGTNNDVPPYLGVNLNRNSVHTNDTSTDLNMELGNDLFGLRSLGLFDDGSTKGANGGSYLPPTKNPFVYE